MRFRCASRRAIRLEVSGPAREVVLGRALPEGAVPMSLSAPLPARIDPDGKLRVQVRPGTYFVEIDARLPGPVESLSLPAPDGPWDDREEWVFDARPSLRQVSVEGAPSVDPQQTELPDDWRALPAFALEPGSALRFVTKRRGDADPAPDRLALVRSWWLDFDGKGYTVSDRIRGAIVRSDRLSMAPGSELGRVAVNGRDQFITRLPGRGEQRRRGPARRDRDLGRQPHSGRGLARPRRRLGRRLPERLGGAPAPAGLAAALRLGRRRRVLYLGDPLVAARSLRRARGGDGVPAPLRRALGGARARGPRAHLHRARSTALGVDRRARGRGAAPRGRSRAARRGGAHAVAARARRCSSCSPSPSRWCSCAAASSPRSRTRGSRGRISGIAGQLEPRDEDGRGRTGDGPGGNARVQGAGIAAASRARLRSRRNAKSASERTPDRATPRAGRPIPRRASPPAPGFRPGAGAPSRCAGAGPSSADRRCFSCSRRRG